MRTGEVAPAYAGPVRIYASGNPPPGAVDLGVIEVHGEQQEGTVDELLPMFVRRVAAAGGDAAVIDGVRARFEMVPRVQIETGYVICGRGHPCATKSAYGTTDEVMIVSIFGRAMTTRHASAPVPTPAPALAPAPAPVPDPDPVPSSREPERGPPPDEVIIP